MSRGMHYLDEYPGFGGWLLLAACSGAVFLAGAKILDCLKYEQAERKVAELQLAEQASLSDNARQI